MSRGVFPKSRRVLSFCAALGVALAIPPAAAPRVRACPPPPLFSEYVEEADVVVVGKVVGYEQVPVESDDGEERAASVATFRAEEVLKGEGVEQLRLAGYYVDHDESGPGDRTLLAVATGVEEYGARYVVAVPGRGYRFIARVSRGGGRDAASSFDV